MRICALCSQLSARQPSKYERAASSKHFHPKEKGREQKKITATSNHQSSISNNRRTLILNWRRRVEMHIIIYNGIAIINIGN
jgi:hypothetical protein